MSNKEPYVVQRTVTRILDYGEKKSQSLGAYRDLPAYVLLGDSGAGKTTAFKKEAETCGGEYITARNLITFGDRSSKSNSVLFIDGLDEVRIANEDPRDALDKIRPYLWDLRKNNIPFRLSCRAADWLGTIDTRAMKDISPNNSELTILYLDPLTEEDIELILRNQNVPNLDNFLRNIRKHKLIKLLRNPQILNLLVKAVGKENKWPENRCAIYAMACKAMVVEENSEHRIVKKESISKLLDAAGYLCALQLLSGVSGFALDKNEADKQYVDIQELDLPDLIFLPSVKQVVSTNLFQYDSENQCRRIPIHRSIAEYLGAEYLSKLIRKDLPFERLLNLMVDETGDIASDLRGLCAWIAVHCMGMERKILIEKNPFGIIAYGDIHSFSIEEKKLILKAFKNNAKNVYYLNNFDDGFFGVVGTADMLPIFQAEFQDIFSSRSHTNADEKYLAILLTAIAEGDSMPELKDFIEKVIRDSGYKPFVRADAVKALIQCIGSNNITLLKLAEEVRDGFIEDRDGEVLGVFLDKLYPNVITPKKVWDYFHISSSYFVSRYIWLLYNKPEKVDKKDLPTLLNALVQKKFNFENFSWIEIFIMQKTVGQLLVRALQEYGNIVDIAELYNWLSLGVNKYKSPILEGKEAAGVKKWFAEHPEKYKEVVEYRAAVCSNSNNFHLESEIFQGAPYPEDLELWYLKKAKLESKKYPKLAQVYFKAAVNQLRMDQALTNQQLVFIEAEIEDYPLLQKCLEDLTTIPIGGWEQEHARERKRLDYDRQKAMQERENYYLEYLSALREGTAPIGILYNLARAYNGEFSNIDGATSEDRLKIFLNNNQVLVDAAYMSFNSVLKRTDLPKVKEIIQLKTEKKAHSLRPVCLIEVIELYKSDPAAILKFNDNLLETLIAFYFTDYSSVKTERQWLIDVMNHHPILVEQVLCQYILAMVKTKNNEDFIAPLLHHIFYDEIYSNLTQRMLVILLNKFPLRVSQKCSENILALILITAINRLDKKTLRQVIKEKLKKSSMDSIQKIYWLACGFFILSTQYIEELKVYVVKNQNHKNILGNFIQKHWEKIPVSELNEKAIGLLIELLAPECAPAQLMEPSFEVTPAMQFTHMIYNLIKALCDNSNKKSDELKRLVKAGNIISWQAEFESALHNKQIADFQYPDVHKVCSTLKNELPVNPGDLCAITMDLLREIAKNIRDGNTNAYRQYWNDPTVNHKKEWSSKDEASCRDTLLDDLNVRLKQYKSEGHREGNYADDKRADIKVVFEQKFNVPIEIKKDSHRDLWKAVHEQLIKKYVRDPGTGGYGIYLVFWFGDRRVSVDPSGLKKVQNAKELEQRLEQSLSDEERLRIKILVIDCSLPS